MNAVAYEINPDSMHTITSQLLEDLYQARRERDRAKAEAAKMRARMDCYRRYLDREREINNKLSKLVRSSRRDD